MTLTDKLKQDNLESDDPTKLPGYDQVELEDKELGRMFKEKGNTVTTISVLDSPMKKLRPISIHDNIAYIRVDLPTKKEIAKGDYIDVSYQYDAYFVTSEKQLIHHQSPEIQERFQMPIMIPGDCMRWDKKDLWNFLKIDNSLDLKELYQSTEQIFRKYIDFPVDGYYTIVSLWVIGTYISRLFSYYPYLDFYGSPGSAKTKVNSLLEKLAFNAEMSNKISGAAIYRSIESSGCTLILDETEFLKDPKSEQNQIILSILKGAFRTNGTIKVTIPGKGNDNWIPHSFDAGSCIALGHINGIDNVLAERNIPIHMLKTLNKEIGDSEVPENVYDSVWIKQRSKFYRLFLTYFQEILELIQKSYDVDSISNRELNQIWKPIITLARLFEKYGVEGLLDNVEKVITVSHNKKMASDQSVNVDTLILGHLVDCFTNDPKVTPIGQNKDTQNWYRQKDIVERLTKEEDLGWINSKNIGEPLERLGFTRIKKTGGMCVYIDNSILISLCKRYDLDFQELMKQSNFDENVSLLSSSSLCEQKNCERNDENDENDEKIPKIEEIS